MLLLATILAAQATAGPSPTAPPSLPALELRWTVPESCPTEADVRTQVAEFLEGFATRQLAADGTIHRHDDRWTLVLRFDGQTKELTAGRCEDLTRAAALILSLALNPSGEHDPDADATAERAENDDAAPTTSVAPKPAPAAPPPAPTEEPPPRFPRALLRASAGIGAAVPAPLTSGGLTTVVAWPRAQVELAGVLWTPADLPSQRGTGYRAIVTMGWVHARGCGVPSVGPLRFPLCGGVAMGAMRVGDRSPSGRQVSHRLLLGATASAAMVWMFRPWAGVWLGAETTVGRPTSEVPLAESTEVFRSSLALVRVAAGVEFHFFSRARARAGNTGR